MYLFQEGFDCFVQIYIYIFIYISDVRYVCAYVYILNTIFEMVSADGILDIVFHFKNSKQHLKKGQIYFPLLNSGETLRGKSNCALYEKSHLTLWILSLAGLEAISDVVLMEACEMSSVWKMSLRWGSWE